MSLGVAVGRLIDTYGLIDGFATSIEAAPQTLDGRTDHGTEGRTRTSADVGRGEWRANKGRRGRKKEGGKCTERNGRKAAVSTAACAHGGTNGYRAIDVRINAAEFNFRNVTPTFSTCSILKFPS